jgi:hypothetical protein
MALMLARLKVALTWGQSVAPRQGRGREGPGREAEDRPQSFLSLTVRTA